MIKETKHTKTVAFLVVVVLLMVGLVAASEPLYRLFCNATGLGGTTRNAPVAPGATGAASGIKGADREITVSFDGNVDPALPWDFVPEIRSMKVKLGQEAIVNFRAHNRGNKTLVGMAIHNVQPDKAGPYFDKTQCFCFTEQVLKPGQTDEMPVQFFIDPEIAKDRTEDDVTAITLSYTFYLAKSQEKAHTAAHEHDGDMPMPSSNK